LHGDVPHGMKVEKKAANGSREGGASLTIKKKKKTDVPAKAAPAAAPKKKLKRAADASESKPKKQKRAAEPAAPSDLSDTAETADTAAADAGCLTNFRLSEATVAALEARGIQALSRIREMRGCCSQSPPLADTLGVPPSAGARLLPDAQSRHHKHT